MDSRNSTVKIIAAVVIIVLLGVALWELVLKNAVSPKSDSMQQVAVPTTVQPSGAMTEGSTYKDGTYTAEGQYQSPSALEKVDVTLTLKDGVITNAVFVGHPQSPTTTTMQNKFKEGFKAEVVGKPVDEVALTVVNGSSLSPKGFMDALSKIKEEAKS